MLLASSKIVCVRGPDVLHFVMTAQTMWLIVHPLPFNTAISCGASLPDHDIPS